jgi:hypothetical protein
LNSLAARVFGAKLKNISWHSASIHGIGSRFQSPNTWKHIDRRALPGRLR